jgi:hypothetical protein
MAEFRAAVSPAKNAVFSSTELCCSVMQFADWHDFWFWRVWYRRLRTQRRGVTLTKGQLDLWRKTAAAVEARERINHWKMLKMGHYESLWKIRLPSRVFICCSRCETFLTFNASYFPDFEQRAAYQMDWCADCCERLKFKPYEQRGTAFPQAVYFVISFGHLHEQERKAMRAEESLWCPNRDYIKEDAARAFLAEYRTAKWQKQAAERKQRADKRNPAKDRDKPVLRDRTQLKKPRFG